MTDAEKVQNAYAQLMATEGFKNLEKRMSESATDKRRDAGKLEPTTAWGELKFADGIEYVLQHIRVMANSQSAK